MKFVQIVLSGVLIFSNFRIFLAVLEFYIFFSSIQNFYKNWREKNQISTQIFCFKFFFRKPLLFQLKLFFKEIVPQNYFHILRFFGKFNFFSICFSNFDILNFFYNFNRIYARSNDVEKAQFALDNSITFLKELERYCKTGYELPKMYSAALPDFGAGKKLKLVLCFIKLKIISFTLLKGAMENWVRKFNFFIADLLFKIWCLQGLITYKEQYLIGDEKSHPRDVLEILKTVAHELGHQFFGKFIF